MATNPPITIGELTDVPAPGSGVTSAYHQEVTNRITHRFANKAALDGWAAANGSVAVTIDAPGIVWTRLAGVWTPRGVAFAGAVSANTAIGSDATWTTIPFATIRRNVLTAYNGTFWAAPWPGLVRVALSIAIAVGTVANANDSYGDYDASASIFTNAANIPTASFKGRFAYCTMTGETTHQATAGQTFYPQGYIGGAAGKFKTVFANNGGLTIEYI